MITKSENHSMLRAPLLFIACIFMAAEITAQGDFSIVRRDGIGPVRVGMNLSEMNKALHTPSKKPTEVHGVAGFTQNGNHVTGWLGPSETDPIPITLDLRENKLTIWTHPQPGRNVVFARCDVTVDGEKMSGTIDTDKGTIAFSRTSHEAPPAVKFKQGN